MGQVIESINGESLKDIDPRIQLGDIITKAEAADGKLAFTIRGVAEPIVVTIPALGCYSPTWPLDCEKSETIVRNFADYLKQPDSHKGFAGFGMLFLVSTGNDDDLATVREWIHAQREQYKGELTNNRGPNTRGDTIWPVAPRTLWEHEALLVRGTFGFPALKPGHLYRIRIDRGQGVGAGDGYQLFINGKPLIESKQGLGRREGLRQRGGWITPEFISEFGSAPVTISAITFLRYGDRAIVQMPPVPQGIFSIWMEERKLPPLDDASFRRAARFVSMQSSEWQANIDPESSEPPTDEGKFRYDGIDHLFIEAGGFGTNRPAGWTPPLIVLKRD